MICPLLRVCMKEVDMEHYRLFCSNLREDKYKECDTYIAFTKVKKTPLEWSKILAPSAGT